MTSADFDDVGELEANEELVPKQVNCTSQESGCRECAGPPPRDIPSDAPEIDIKLLPFGATDVRMGVLPYVWRDPIVEEATEFV